MPNNDLDDLCRRMVGGAGVALLNTHLLHRKPKPQAAPVEAVAIGFRPAAAPIRTSEPTAAPLPAVPIDPLDELRVAGAAASSHRVHQNIANQPKSIWVGINIYIRRPRNM